MSTMTGPTRRPRNQATVGIFTKVTPEAKACVDRWASTANVNLWEILEALIFDAQKVEGPDGLPSGFGFVAQPTLDVSATAERGAAA
jgi:hypothetical protein